MSLGDKDFTSRKDRIKLIRSLFEWIVVVGIMAVLVTLFVQLKTYQPFSREDINTSGEDTGFIALSYFGVDRIGDTSSLIGKDQLRQQLQALKNQGYVTISQSDIEDYYKYGKPLPEKSLYLMFEDGRRDTAIFAHDILEDLNYKATMMTYTEKFEKEDPKFLKPKELKEMADSTFWEMGTNGHRLQFINVFDRYDNYIGEINPLKYAMMRQYLGRRYNHYLMDYIRDKYGMPKESFLHMEKRISYDYERMRDIYTQELGFVPQTYVLMHSNTGRFGNNSKVSAVNERWIRELFTMNFNREGYSLNRRNSSIYDLTRMQPQPYWPINHLLMRIKYDTEKPVDFVAGDNVHQEDWKLLEGASEIKQESYILTSVPYGRGLARLENSQSFRNMHMRVRLEGNSFGTQALLLRTSNNMNNYIAVGVENGFLVVKEKINGNTKELYKESIDILDGKEPISIEEDKRNAEVKELETFARYADNTEQAKEYLAQAQAKKDEPVRTIQDGAEAYKGQQSFHGRLDKEVGVDLKDDKLTLVYEGRNVAEDIQVDNIYNGSVYLLSAWNHDAWSQRNLADDVYDGIYEGLVIRDNTGLELDKEEVLFSSELTGWQKRQLELQRIWESVLGFFLKYL